MLLPYASVFKLSVVASAYNCPDHPRRFDPAFITNTLLFRTDNIAETGAGGAGSAVGSVIKVVRAWFQATGIPPFMAAHDARVTTCVLVSNPKHAGLVYVGPSPHGAKLLKVVLDWHSGSGAGGMTGKDMLWWEWCYHCILLVKLRTSNGCRL